jgi:phospholipid/cholesterol/gamma-HCH transport system substrate-binding protein
MNAAKREIFETWIGAAIIAVLVVVVVLVFGPARFSDGSYEVTARFSRADGLAAGGIVQAAGVPVGEIKELRLDENFRAVAVLLIDDGVELDSDATASIVTDGLFGAKFIQLDVGAGDAIIGDGQEIAFTEDSLVLDDLLQLIISRAKQARSGTGGAATESQP